ncbi:pyridoxamine 5'-phosphate oxidase family protein [Actinokineospora sp. NPDC004072]
MTAAPPRTTQDRLRDTRARLDGDVDLWVATAGPGGPHLVPLSFLWDGATVLISTPLSSVTARNLLADPRVRLSFGPTRDVVMVAGTAEPVAVADLGAEVGDAFAAKTGFDPRTLAQPYQYFRITPQRVQAWREENELQGRVLMRKGRWVG